MGSVTSTSPSSTSSTSPTALHGASEPKESSARARLFLAGSWLLAFVGVGHTVGHVLGAQSPSEAEVAAHRVMAGVAPMAGTSHTLLEFYEGNSLGMGGLYFAFGTLNVLLARFLRRQGLAVPRSVVLCNVVVSAASVVLAVRFFPIPPIVFLAAATLAFAVAWWLGAPSRASSSDRRAGGVSS